MQFPKEKAEGICVQQLLSKTLTISVKEQRVYGNYPINKFIRLRSTLMNCESIHHIKVLTNQLILKKNFSTFSTLNQKFTISNKNLVPTTIINP